MNLFIVVLCLLVTTCAAQNRPSESERVKLWYEAKNTWPPTWQPETEAFKAAASFRESEIMNIPGADERWENWMQFIQGRLVPKFTPRGFEIVRTPDSIRERLYNAVMKGVNDWDNLPLEGGVDDAIYGELSPKFVNIGNLGWEILEELREMHEEWAGGIPLIPTSAYGVRLYQNGSSLVMHYDKVGTHVISSIVHIVHSYDKDDEPWPIQIEDHDGNIFQAILQEGDMLHYESAKALHGRMTRFRGKYYGSIFLHYMPVGWNITTDVVIASVPPHWRRNLRENHGSRWAGQAITTDSMVVEGAPPRISTASIRSAHSDL